jgi:hypothetical protein
MPSTPLTSSSEGRRASRSARPAAAASPETTAGCGPSSPALFAHYDPTSCSWRPRQGSFPLGELTGDSGRHPSRRSLVTWPRSGSMRRGHAFAPATSARPTNANASSSSLGWPTPTAADGDRSSQAIPRSNPTLLGAARLWPTPTASNPNEHETPESWLARQQREQAKGRNGNGMGTPLGMAVKLWPTPLGSDGEKGGPSARHGSGTASLPQAVTLWPTPMARDHHGQRSPEQQANGRQLPDVAGSCLNPAWVELLMGFPQGWTATAGPPRRARSRPGSRPGSSRHAASPAASSA